MNADQFLGHAAAVVRDRRKVYGDPQRLFDRVAVRWGQVLGTRVTPAQVILCMVELKLARLSGNPGHADSITDLAGYAAILQEIQE
jgi:hypothetical protein